jgi:hypothetical protein
LLNYHIATLHLLAKCAFGKNIENQNKILNMVNLEQILENVLDLDLGPDGQPDKRVNADTAKIVRAAWLQLLNDVFLTCQARDSATIELINSSKRIFNTFKDRGATTNRNLMGYFAESLESFGTRLERLDSKAYCGRTELLNSVEDAYGNNLGTHLHEVQEIVRGCKFFYSRWNAFVLEKNAPDGWEQECKRQAQAVREHAVLLYAKLEKFEFEKLSKSLIELITTMSLCGVEGGPLNVADGGHVQEVPKSSKLKCFEDGWQKFRVYLTHCLGLDPRQGQGMNVAIFDVAQLFGSEKTYLNGDFQSLKQLMLLMCDPECDDAIKLTGLKVLRAILYLNPDAPYASQDNQEIEYERNLKNLPCSFLSRHEFHHIQATLAKLGCVEVIFACFQSENREVVSATLRLAVTLLDGGNYAVQTIFAHELIQAASAPFFERLQRQFDQALNSMREAKRMIRQELAERIAMAKAGIHSRKVTAEESTSLASGQQDMVEVIKVMPVVFNLNTPNTCGWQKVIECCLNAAPPELNTDSLIC